MARPALASIAALTVMVLVAVGVVAAAQNRSVDRAALMAWGERGVTVATQWAEAGYKRRPAVMIGLAGLLALPMIALIGLIAHRLLSKPASTPAQPPAASQALPRAAWLELTGDSSEPVEIRRELIQIGRESDNDICLADSTVHRYHAVIERSGEQGFVITDMSGPSGNGVRVNGARMTRARLTDGDVVELGKARLKFATAA